MGCSQPSGSAIEQGSREISDFVGKRKNNEAFKVSRLRGSEQSIVCFDEVFTARPGNNY